MPFCRILTEQQRKWLDSNCCPICGLPKKEWKRRTDWTCCSTKCTKEYSDEHIFVWQYWKVKAFERDKYTCIRCGFQSLAKYPFSSTWNNFTEFKEWQEQRSVFKEWEGTTAILFCPEYLIADHIIPIAIGGEEYDLDNVQTLCLGCNKNKTKRDLKEIALFRKKDKEQEIL